MAGHMVNNTDPDQKPQSTASDLGLHHLLRAVCPKTECKCDDDDDDDDDKDDDDDDDDDDEFRFNDASTHEGHLRQNCILTCFSIERAVMVTHLGKYGNIKYIYLLL